MKIKYSDKGVEIEIDQALVLIDDDQMTEMLGVNKAQCKMFRHKHRILRVPGTNRYSLVETLAAVAKRGDHASSRDCDRDIDLDEDFDHDPGVAALQGP